MIRFVEPVFARCICAVCDELMQPGDDLRAGRPAKDKGRDEGRSRDELGLRVRLSRSRGDDRGFKGSRLAEDECVGVADGIFAGAASASKDA